MSTWKIEFSKDFGWNTTKVKTHKIYQEEKDGAGVYERKAEHRCVWDHGEGFRSPVWKL
jgi:hypothetical protein